MDLPAVNAKGLKTGTLVVTLPDAWCYGGSARCRWRRERSEEGGGGGGGGVVLRLSLICSRYVSSRSRLVVGASLKYTVHVARTLDKRREQAAHRLLMPTCDLFIQTALDLLSPWIIFQVESYHCPMMLLLFCWLLNVPATS